MLLIVFKNNNEFLLFFQYYHKVNTLLTYQKMYLFCKSVVYLYY